MKKRTKKTIRDISLRFLKTSTIAYILFCILVFFIQKSLIFFPLRNTLPFPVSETLKEVSIKTEDNIKLDAWFMDNKSDKIVIFFHWNWWNLYYNQERLKILDELKLNALVFDYRWYWKSEWEIKNEEDLYRDWEAVYNYLIDKGYKSKQIILWWQSLGWAIAINTAQYKDIYWVISESTFYSMDRMARKQFSFLPTRLLLRYHFRNYEKINNIKAPILFIHSKNDEMIGFENGKNLFEARKWEKTFLETSGSHNYWFIKDYNLYVRELKKFLRLQ